MIPYGSVNGSLIITWHLNYMYSIRRLKSNRISVTPLSRKTFFKSCSSYAVRAGPWPKKSWPLRSWQQQQQLSPFYDLSASSQVKIRLFLLRTQFERGLSPYRRDPGDCGILTIVAEERAGLKDKITVRRFKKNTPCGFPSSWRASFLCCSILLTFLNKKTSSALTLAFHVLWHLVRQSVVLFYFLVYRCRNFPRNDSFFRGF